MNKENLGKKLVNQGMVDELGIRKRCKNCRGWIHCAGTKAPSQCGVKEFACFFPSENALKLRCAELLLERDRALNKVSKLEERIKELNRAHAKKLKECRKLWKKEKERQVNE